MNFFQAIALAVLQGVTEFVPVSSSGHLVLLRRFAGWADEDGLFFDIVLHAASMAALLVYFRRDLADMALAVLRPAAPQTAYARRLPALLIAATLPTIIASPALMPFLEYGVRSAAAAALSMIMTALWFAFAERRYAPTAIHVGFRQALIIGCAQVIALLPGASRSGWTTAAGMLCGLDREKSVRFAFLMALPAAAGALALALVEAAAGSKPLNVPAPALAVGFMVCFGVSLAAIHFCIRFFRRHSLKLFAAYLAAAGAAAFLLDLCLR